MISRLKVLVENQVDELDGEPKDTTFGMYCMSGNLVE